MNIILIGPNGAGKTTLSKLLYKKNFHLFKLSPLADNNTVSISMALSDFNIVFDRWSPIDLAVYRDDEGLFTTMLGVKDLLKHNLIIYLENDNEYDASFSDGRVVQRPKDLVPIIKKYRNYVLTMIRAGITVFELNVSKDINETLQRVERLILQFSENKLNKGEIK